MAILPNRETLKEKLAESLTSPDFIALSTLDPGDGTYLSLEGRVRCRKGPVKLEVQRPADGDHLEYSLIKDCLKFCGKVDLVEDEKGRIIARVSLDRVNGKPVFVVPDRRGNETICYKRNGKFVRMTKERIGDVNYWVPTIINHMCQNADYFFLLGFFIYKAFYELHAYYWWIFLVAVGGHFIAAAVHTNVWPR